MPYFSSRGQSLSHYSILGCGTVSYFSQSDIIPLWSAHWKEVVACWHWTSSLLEGDWGPCLLCHTWSTTSAWWLVTGRNWSPQTLGCTCLEFSLSNMGLGIMRNANDLPIHCELGREAGPSSWLHLPRLELSSCRLVPGKKGAGKGLSVIDSYCSYSDLVYFLDYISYFSLCPWDNFWRTYFFFFTYHFHQLWLFL